MSKVTCIDVSTWNKNIDFAKVKASGIEAVIIRAGFGRETSQKDNEFETHYKNARAVGLKIGAYWYSYANSVEDAKREAKACLSCIKGKTFELPIYFDMEESNQTSYGKTTLTNMAIAFCDAIKAGGYRAGVYSNLNWLTNYLNYNTLKSKYSIWLAQWSSGYSLSCDIWQNASDGRINGVSGNVDTNVIINRSVIQGSTSKPTSTTTSTISATSTNYKVKVTSDNGLNVRKGTGTSYSIITAIPYGTTVTVTKEQNGWGYITEKSGWISLAYTAKVSATSNTSTAIKAGMKLSLKNTPLYVSSTAKSKATTVSGTYYLWDTAKINGRYRITNSTSNVGKASQVTGWIDQSYVK